MEYIRNVPLIFSSIMTIIVGAICYQNNEKSGNIYLKMAICLTVFYILGIYIKKTIEKTAREIEKKAETEKEEQISKKEPKS